MVLLNAQCCCTVTETATARAEANKLQVEASELQVQLSIAQTEIVARDKEHRLLKVYHTTLRSALEKQDLNDAEGIVERILVLLRNVNNT